MNNNSVPTMNSAVTDHYSSHDDVSLVSMVSLRTERMIENAPTNRVKHLALNKCHSVYKNIMADVSQVTDGRSLRSMELLQHDLNESFPTLGSETKSLPTNDRWDAFRRNSVDGSAHLHDEKRKRDFRRRHSIDMPTPMPREESVHRQSIDSNDSLLSSLSLLIEENGSSANKDSDHENSTDTLNSGNNDHSVEKEVNNATPTKPPEENTKALVNSDPTLLSTSNPGSSVAAKKSTSKNPKLSLRHKFVPHHRCPSINGMVTGIVKPSRYSSASSNNCMIDTSAHSSIHSSTHSFNLNTSMHSTQSWVPTGVHFSENMEIYVFEK